MLTIQIEELLDRLKAGVFDPMDVQTLEQAPLHDFLAEVEAAYPVRFQERRIREKWEIGLARRLRLELASFSSNRACFPLLVMMPVFRHCLFLSGEGDAITGIGLATRLMVKPIQKPFQGLALTTGRGFKLERTPDGWDIKPLMKRTVKLTDDFMQKRGWRFDLMHQFTPKP